MLPLHPVLAISKTVAPAGDLSVLADLNALCHSTCSKLELVVEDPCEHHVYLPMTFTAEWIQSHAQSRECF